MKILLTGGGTGGSITPLLAIKEEFDKNQVNEFLWVGSKKGLERQMVIQQGINYKSIPSGKLRRYFDWRNFTDIFLIFGGFLKSFWIILRFRPDVILTAGSFVCVPLVWAAAIMRKKIFVHQQDLRIGLANKLMKPFATKITVAFDELQDFFPHNKTELVGNPMRSFLFNGQVKQAIEDFNLEYDLPTLLIMGGGLGSDVLNKIFIEASEKLTAFCQVIHVLGKGEQSKWLTHPKVVNNVRYHAVEFLSKELADVYAVSDLVVCRSGLSTLTELSALRKPTITIPIPNNQQVDNAQYFNQKKAVVYVQQDDLEAEYIVNLIKNLYQQPMRLKELGQNIYNAMPQNAAAEYVSLIKNTIVSVDKNK